MLSYQHAYHAGGPADVHKHFALAGLLETLLRDPEPLTIVETHAGRALYHLDSAEAKKTGEAAEGIALTPRSDHPFWPLLDRFREDFGATAYPGSPMIAAGMLRRRDGQVLFELHPAEHAALVDAMEGSDAQIQRADGYAGTLALPRADGRTLVLIDPSYEVKSEYAEMAEFTHRLLARWPDAMVMIWYPILPAARHEAMRAALPPHLAQEVRFDLKGGKGMRGSGLAFVNAPEWISDVLASAVAAAPFLRVRR
ncbi:MAG: 23S rRNA (adenine(2030)-N(6))-methyltransferase RlmJ [Rubricella sp.]